MNIFQTWRFGGMKAHGFQSWLILMTAKMARPRAVEGVIAEHAAGPQNPGDFGNDLGQVADMLQDVATEYGAERSVLERERFARRPSA